MAGKSGIRRRSTLRRFATSQSETQAFGHAPADQSSCVPGHARAHRHDHERGGTSGRSRQHRDQRVTLNDLVLARYTADSWRGRIYAARYFLVFISTAVAIGMISLLHQRGGFYLVLAVNAGIAFAMFVATAVLAVMARTIETQQTTLHPADEIESILKAIRSGH